MKDTLRIVEFKKKIFYSYCTFISDRHTITDFKLIISLNSKNDTNKKTYHWYPHFTTE